MELLNEIAILIIEIIEIDSDYSYFIDIYSFDLGNYIPKMQISVFFHNSFLLFSSTAMQREDLLNNEEEINYFSMIMIFGYPNGTDCTLESTENFFIDEEFDLEQIPSFHLFEFLIQNFTIENNIFGYEPIYIIKLVSIPEEIIIVEKQENNEINQLANDSFIYRNNIYGIKQNKSLLKTSRYYYIDYQYMSKEATPSIFSRRLQYEDRNIFYGRINRLKFKLCHEYCESCYELSASDNNQKCLSCVPEYQYDYLYFNQKINENQLLNCVPEGYYIDEGNLIPCYEYDTKYYINTTDNKKICFKNSYDCPFSYPFYNDETKECFYCDFVHYIKGKCSFHTLFKDSGFFSCKSNNNINEPKCFNNIIKFDRYQINNFAQNKNGDFLIQYNEHNNDELISSRLFYGLTKNGSYFPSIKQISFIHEFNKNIDEEILEDSYFLTLFELLTKIIICLV